MGTNRSTPSHLDAPLETYLTTRLPPSASSISPIYRETTICYSYMCPFAYGCTEKAARPAQVMKRRCMRYLPESMRIEPGLSEHALDLLAKRRGSGDKLSATTTAILDQLRPDGPIRKP